MNSFYTSQELHNIGLASFGENVLISRFARFYGPENISIGNNVRIDDFCILSGKIVLHDYIHIAAYCCLFGGGSGIELMDFSGLSSRCAIYADSDDYSGAALTNPMIPEKYRNVTGGKVTLEKHVVIGTGVTILPNVSIKEGSSIGSMSLVSKTLESWGIYVGIPCKRIRERSRALLELEDKFIKEERQCF